MSGGHWEYVQFRIDDVADDIERMVKENKVERPYEDLSPWDYDKDGNVYEDRKYYYCWDDKTIERFKEAAKVIRKAAAYIHEIDWLVCGDTSEETFVENIEKKLKELEERQ